MVQRIYIFKNQIIITDKIDIKSDKDTIFYEPIDWIKVKDLCKKSQNLTLVLVVKNVDEAIQEFKQKTRYIKAAGGVVCNQHNSWIMIYRLHHWDLPKGKIDEGEEPLQTAIREIKEEINADVLIDTNRFLCKTYHMYHINDELALKETYWYYFQINENSILKPQQEEDIRQICWVDVFKWQEIKMGTYDSIKDVVETFLSSLV